MDRKSGTGTGASDQVNRFREAARQLGCDEDEAGFDEKLRHIAKQKPKDNGTVTASKDVEG